MPANKAGHHEKLASWLGKKAELIVCVAFTQDVAKQLMDFSHITSCVWLQAQHEPVNVCGIKQTH